MSEDKIIAKANEIISEAQDAEVKALRMALQKANEALEETRLRIIELETVVRELKNRNSVTTYSYE